MVLLVDGGAFKRRVLLDGSCVILGVPMNGIAEPYSPFSIFYFIFELDTLYSICIILDMRGYFFLIFWHFYSPLQDSAIVVCNVVMVMVIVDTGAIQICCLF